MKNLLLIALALFAFSSMTIAQKKYLEPNKNYSKVKIIQNGEMPITAKNLTLINDTLLQYSITTNGTLGSPIQLQTGNIQKILVKKGTYAGEYALVCGLGALAGGLLGVQQAKNDPLYVDDGESHSGLIIGLTAGGAVFGALIGALIPKWKPYFIQDKSTSYNFKVVPNIGNNYYGVGLTVKL